MKKILIFCLLAYFFCPNLQIVYTQEEEKNQEIQIKPKASEKSYPAYFSVGRRDPFTNLLTARELKAKNNARTVAELSVDDIKLIGIIKMRDKFTAIIGGGKGFPFYINTGDEFTDGYVLSIQDYQIVFRKTKERGLPLIKPKDVTKEIYPEER